MLSDMLVFGVYSTVSLTQKPEWLDVFRAKYDKPYAYHVTLKQSCFLDEDQKEEVRARLDVFFQKRMSPKGPIELVFSKLVKARELHDGCTTIMIDAEPHPLLERLQKEIVTVLDTYRNYCKAESEVWERDFHPHITIARNLPDDQLLLAERDLHSDLVCRGVITQVVLSRVKEDTPEEAKKLENQTTYLL